MRDLADGLVAAPFQLYGSGLRANQGHVTKMPRDFVNRWEQPTDLATSLATIQDAFSTDSETAPFVSGIAARGRLRSVPRATTPTSSPSRQPLIAGAVGTRRWFARWASGFKRRGIAVSTPHPRDLLVNGSVPVIVEAKTTGVLPAVLAVRTAVGQLLEYRFFLGPQDAERCILLDLEEFLAARHILVPWKEPAGGKGSRAATGAPASPR